MTSPFEDPIADIVARMRETANHIEFGVTHRTAPPGPQELERWMNAVRRAAAEIEAARAKEREFIEAALALGDILTDPAYEERIGKMLAFLQPLLRTPLLVLIQKHAAWRRLSAPTE